MTPRRYVRAEWSCPKCGASNPKTIAWNEADRAAWPYKQVMPPPGRTLFEPKIRYRSLASLEGEEGWLEVECPRCWHLQHFACADAVLPDAGPPPPPQNMDPGRELGDELPTPLSDSMDPGRTIESLGGPGLFRRIGRFLGFA